MPNDLTEAKFWNDTWHSQKIDSLRQWMRRLAIRKMLNRIVQLIDMIGKPEADILEIGCAPGTMLENIHRLRPQHRLHGLDYWRGASRLQSSDSKQKISMRPFIMQMFVIFNHLLTTTLYYLSDSLSISKTLCLYSSIIHALPLLVG